jgi:hypothetical protein
MQENINAQKMQLQKFRCRWEDNIPRDLKEPRWETELDSCALARGPVAVT